jgi:hypothetical protein
MHGSIKTLQGDFTKISHISDFPIPYKNEKSEIRRDLVKEIGGYSKQLFVVVLARVVA